MLIKITDNFRKELDSIVKSISSIMKDNSRFDIEKFILKYIIEELNFEYEYVVFSHYSHLTQEIKWVIHTKQYKYIDITKYFGAEYCPQDTDRARIKQFEENNFILFFEQNDKKQSLIVQKDNIKKYSDDDDIIFVSKESNAITRPKKSVVQDNFFYNYRQSISEDVLHKINIHKENINVHSYLSENGLIKNNIDINPLVDYLLSFDEINSLFYIPSKDINSSYLNLLIASPKKHNKNDNDKIIGIQHTLSYISSVIKGAENEMLIRQPSIKSAIAAIMSRNMSHNLGSHILFYIKEHLRNVQTIFKNNVLAELINATITDIEWNKDNFSLKEKIKKCLEDEKYNDELPFLVGLGHFISYLQERQDYIATICTDYVPYFSTVDFKQAIYDELTPDACHSRHHENRKGEKTENLLLKYIAKSEGFGRCIENNEYKKDEKNIIIKFREDFEGLNTKDMEGNYIEHKELNNMRKIKLSLPGGYTGRQAFFSIVENIIRNAAKHGKLKSENTNLMFTIDVWEESNLPKDEFWDKYRTPNIKDFHIIKITDNCEIDDDILQKLRERLDDDYLDVSGKLKETNKGLKEMRISATWLRNESYTEKQDNIKPPILEVNKTEKNNLEYVFCIKRPKEIAVISGSTINKDDRKKINENLQEHYCKLFTPDEFKDDTKLNYNFIVCENDTIYEKILPHSHSLIIEDNELFKTLTDSTKIATLDIKKEISEKIFEKYLKLDKIDKIDKICISDGKVKEKINDFQFGEYINIIDGGDFKEKYIYRVHFESTNEFYPFMKNNFNRINNGEIEFVEGITGHNSTARLLRTETIDKLWYYKHLNAMKAQVAIFDERFFDRYTKISHNEILQYDWWTKIIEQYNDIDEIKEKLLDEDEKLKKSSEFKILNTKEKLKFFMNNRVGIQNEFKTSELYPYLYKLKGVEFFNIVYRKEKKEFVIVGYLNVEHSYSKETEEYIYNGCVYKVIGKISYENEKINIKLSDDYKTDFDFICIHQGLLDKIYEQFKIKAADLVNRANVTKEIYEKFSNKKVKIVEKTFKVDNKEVKYEYLPKFIIHSGRSKPSEDDMPQHQPFVQFSALENVIANCKYSLVELLNMAHYE